MWRPWSEADEHIDSDEDVEFAVDDDTEILEDAEDPSTSSSDSIPRTHLPVLAKLIILNVYLYLKSSEGEIGAMKKTSEMSKTSYTTVRRIVVEGVQERKVRKDAGISRKLLEKHHAGPIRRLIYEAYDKNIVLTIKTLHEQIRSILNIKCCEESLRTFLRKIGFFYKTISKRQVIMESRKISEWRARYLKEIHEIRKKNLPIIYLDETWFDSHDTVNKGWTDGSGKCAMNVPPSRGKRIIILHAGSEAGWVNDALLLSAKDMKEAKVDYHENMSAELFEKWFAEKLLPNIPANSVIVMDNASYHSAQKEKIPNMSSKKEDIQEFLIANDLYFEETYTKKQLMEVLKTKTFEKKYNVDNMAKERGFKVLRLPPYHCNFNPIEMIWGELKQRLRRNNTAPKFSSATIELIKEEVANISHTSWQNCVKHVIREEDLYRSRLVPELIINLDDESSDDSDCYDNDS